MKPKKGAATNYHRSQQPQTLHLLRKGSLVEISTDEEGFKGVWFAATLLSPPSSNKNNPNSDKAYVEYRNLVSEEDSSLPLREYVNAAFIRPVPPEETHPKPFELDDIVDAYYLDGWWTGVITRLLQDNSTFLVAFQNPTDEIEFGFSDLRFHRDWVNGNWLRPVNQIAAGMMFSVGKKVEISFDSEGHQESWFPATVLEETGNGIFRTQYQIQDRSGLVGQLNAIVDSLHIRPCPPHLKDKNFFLFEKVDAFYDCGWRSGVITKELANSRYVVFFKQSNKDREFSHSELRPHMEWKDGKWFTASQDVLISSDYQDHGGHVCNSTNMLEIAVSLGSSGSTKSLSGDKLLSNSNSRENQVEKPSGVAPHVPSDFVHKECSVNEIPIAIPSPTASPVSANTVEAPSEEKISNVVSPRSESIGNNSKQPLGGDQSSDSHSWGKRIKRKRMKFNELEYSPMSGVETNDGFTEVPVERAQNSIDGLACDKMRSSRAKKPSQSIGGESSKNIGDWAGLDDTGLHIVKVIDQFELGEKSQKRRRGRPPKSATKSSIPSRESEVTTSMDTLGAGQERVTNGSGKKPTVNNQIKQKHKQGVANTTLRVPNDEVAEDPIKHHEIKQKHKQGIAKTSLRVPNDEVAKDPIKQYEKHSQKRGRKRKIILNTASQARDSSNATEQKKKADPSSMRKDVEMVTKELSNTSDDQPLSKWFEEMHPPTTNDGSRVSPQRNVEEQAEASSEQQEIVRGSSVVEKRNGAAESEPECLPFVKNTILWSTIESMEVFRKMPQKPHFRPLEQCKESSREGLAVGFMVTFSSVVERTSRLQFDDPKSKMDEILETLGELESHGFDVEVLRARITSFVAGKEKQENLESQIEEIGSEIGEHNLEMAEIDEEVDEITRQMKELQEKLSVAMSKKEDKDREIANLQSELEGIKEGVRSIQSGFEGLATLL